MNYFQDIKKIDKPTAVALGLFDGVHIGHQAVLKRAAAEQKNSLEPLVFSFSTNHGIPDNKRNFVKIVTESIRRDIIERQGIHTLMEPDFNSIKGIGAERFIHDILIDTLRAEKIFCGYDYRFGKEASGDVELLCRIAEPHAEVTVLPPVLLDGEPVSSTRIREAISVGKIDFANRLLGYDYCFDFPVVSGAKIGRTIGIPTINQIFQPQFLIPKFGVYASYLKIGRKTYRGVTNVGVKPTIHNTAFPLAETHIIDYTGNLYGKKIRVHLTEFLREEQKFESISELKAMILQNIEQVKAKYCAAHQR